MIEAAGFVPRIVGYAQFDDQPVWQPYECARALRLISGRVTDDTGKPLADVEVQLRTLRPTAAAATNRRMSIRSRPMPLATFARIKFLLEAPPSRPRKSGYCRPGLGQPIKMPATDVANHDEVLRTHHHRRLRRSRCPAGYIVMMTPEGGEAVGKWAGSGNIDAENRIIFRDVTPGRFVIRGQPNPSTADQQSKPVNIELKPGQASRVTLPAKP